MQKQKSKTKTKTKNFFCSVMFKLIIPSFGAKFSFGKFRIWDGFSFTYYMKLFCMMVYD